MLKTSCGNHIKHLHHSLLRNVLLHILNIFEKFKNTLLSTLKKWNIYLCFFSKETFYFIDQRYTLLVLEEKSSTVN